MAVAYHIPWAVNTKTSKPIPVIPLLYDIIFIRKSITGKHISHIGIRKTEIFIILHIFYCIHIKVIQSGKYTFLWYSKTPGKNCKIQTAVRFQCLTKQRSDIIYHSIIVTWLVSLIQRNIILINQNDRLLTIMFLQKAG